MATIEGLSAGISRAPAATPDHAVARHDLISRAIEIVDHQADLDQDGAVAAGALVEPNSVRSAASYALLQEKIGMTVGSGLT